MFVSPTIIALGYLGAQLRPGIDSSGALSDGFSASLDVWRMASSLDMRPLTPWIVALMVALAIVCAREVTERSSR